MSFGLAISARAIATRCCWPPDISRGQVVGPRPQADPLEVLERQRVALPPRHALVVERQRDVLERGLEGDQVERLEDEADEAVAVGRAAWLSDRSFISVPSRR